VKKFIVAMGGRFEAVDYPAAGCTITAKLPQGGRAQAKEKLRRMACASAPDNPDQPCAEGGKKCHERPFHQTAQQAPQDLFTGDHAQTSSKKVTASSAESK
jgi:hypothetical protein